MLHIFGKYFFPHIIKGKEEVPELHLQLIAFLSSPDDGAGVYPRGFAKTTWEKIDTLHDIVYALEPVILYTSYPFTDAKFHFESIKGELEANELLRSVYGNLVPPNVKGQKWTNSHFQTTNGINVVARTRLKGRGVNIKNQRPTKIVIDDIEDDQSVDKPEQREKLWRWIMQVVFPSKDKKRGRVKMIGTVLHKEAAILKFYNDFGGIFRKAIENDESIWPEYFSKADLARIRDGWVKPDGTIVKGIGTRAFNTEYLNSPTDDSLARIKAEWINANYFTSPLTGVIEEVIYIDPQAGEKATADEYAITCVAWNRKDIHRYVVEQKAGRASQFEQAKEVVRMWARHPKARVVGVEKVLNQTAVFQILMDWKAKKINFNTVIISVD